MHDNPWLWLAVLTSFAVVIEYAIYGAVLYRVARRLFRRFVKADRGVVAIEAAIVFPVLMAMVAGGLDLWQASNQRSAVVTTAASAAAIGGRAIKAAGITGALAAVQSAYAANVKGGLFTAGSVPTLGTVQALDANGSPTNDPDAAVAVQVTVSATCSPLIPFPGMSVFSASATVRG